MGIWANSNVSSSKCVTIIALKPNQLQVTTFYPQANAIIERVHKVVNDMLRSFDLELHGLLEAPIIQHCRQHHVNLCLAEI
jgi:hypothetical protein